MENKKRKDRRTNPKQSANFISKLTFWYNNELLKKGFKKELDEENLYDVLPDFKTSVLGDNIEREWNLQKNHKQYAMFFVFWNIFGKHYCLLFLTTSIYITINVIRPVLIGILVSYFTPNQTFLSKTNAYLYGLLLVLLQIIQVVWTHNYNFAVESISIKVRTAICSLIYRKILKFSASEIRHASFGEIINLITKDINVFERFFNNFSQACSGFIAAIIICYHLYQKIGLPAVVAIVLYALFFLFQVCMGIWIGYLRKLSSDKTDTRIALLKDALSNIRSIKMYVWETYLEQQLSKTRKNEITVLLKMFRVLIATLVTATIVNSVTFYLVVLSYIWFGHTLTAETIYYINGAFIGLAYSMVTALPYGTFYFSQAMAAIKRMQNLVSKLEIKPKKLTHREVSNNPTVEMRNVTINLSNKTVLNDVSFRIKTGLTLITGYAGSGKSLLLLTILQEFELTNGELFTQGRISYASQEPWIFPSTIRQNIIFGNKYDKHRYQEVIKVCALEYDFAQLEMGDKTIVADRGINLSKGQQSRISLARAIYKDCEIYLLDNCLCSLDSLVSHFIFTNCIKKYLQNKVVMLVSHTKNLLRHADFILNINKGSVSLSKNNFSLQNVKEVDEDFSSKILNCQMMESEDNFDPESKLLFSKQANNIYTEDKKEGAVSCKIYKTYVKLGGGFCFCFFILGTFIATQLSLSYKDTLISNWANLEDQISQFNGSLVNISDYTIFTTKRQTFFYTYTFAVIALSLCTLIRTWALFTFSKKVSVNLHNKMLNSVMNSVITFFDTTFIGNIVNRFSKDLTVVDEDILFILLHLTAIVCETVGNLILIFSTNVKFVVPITILLLVFILLRHVYLKTGRPLKRLDATTKSPVIGYLNSTVEGLATIKVFNAETMLKEEFERRHDLYNSATYSFMSCTKAFVLSVDSCAVIFIAVVVFQFLIFDKGVLPGDVGLAISQVFIMTGVLYYAVYMESGIQTQMTSVERALEYTCLQGESKTGLVLEHWPKQPEIIYKDVCLSVNNEKLFLLKNINFTVKPREKIGVVGRTGAGKTSLISALFRLYNTKGIITIDGVDIRTLSLSFLRSKISIIPQDPVLLQGTLRDNIDPKRIYKDDVIWTALETVQLKHLILDLSVPIEELNFSCGEKQLICLARVLLSKNNILVLDEMVENVDTKTEEQIFQIIEQHFVSSTVIKIAHNLKFVMNCDKIVVMDNGQIVESDHPKVLLTNKNSVFYKMVSRSEVNLL